MACPPTRCDALPSHHPYQVSYGVPTYQTLLTVLTIIAGGFFFDEFSVMPPKDLVWFSFGVAVSLAGVAMHSLHRATVGYRRGGGGVGVGVGNMVG